MLSMVYINLYLLCYYFSGMPQFLTGGFQGTWTSKGSILESTEKFICPNCSKIYSYRRSLLNHIKFECGKDPAFHCHLCDKKMHQKGNLIQHLKNIHKIRNSDELSQHFSKKY